MEVDQHNLVQVLVEKADQEEEEEVSLQSKRTRLRNINSDFEVSSINNGVDSEAINSKGFGGDNRDSSTDSEIASNGVDSYNRNGHHHHHHNEDTSTDSGIANGIDFESPKSGIEEEEEKTTLHNSVYFDQNKVAKSVDEDFEMKNGSLPSFTYGANSRDADVNNIKGLEEGESLIAEMNEYRKNLGDGISDSILTALEHDLEEQTIKSESFNNGTTLIGDFNSIEEVDEGETEFDVVKVLEKQNTHDLYCPKCSSCITRRVILCRKPKIRNARRKTKNNKVETNFPSELDTKNNKVETNFPSELDPVSTNGSNLHGTVEIDSSDSPAPATDTHNSDREPEVNIHSSDNAAHAADNQNNGRDPEVFTCLACFTFFIPTGEGFKLFRRSGDNSQSENVQDPQRTPASNSNWFSSIFRSDKRKIAVEQGNETEPNQHGLLTSAASPSLGLVTDVGKVSEQARREIVISFQEDNKYFENVSPNMREKPDTATVKAANADAATSNYFISTGQEENKKGDPGTPLSGIPVTGEIAEDASTSSPHGGMNSPVSSTYQGTLIPKEVTTETTGSKAAALIATGSKNTGNDVIVIVETSSRETVVSHTQISQGNDGSMQVSSMLQTGTQTYTSEGAGVTIDILKSIVYGGLIESITSLGVVSSAAGAGATTLNILALGLANLIGGLFIIGHNLIELNNDTSSASSNETNEPETRYEATLGRKGKFLLHATVAIISFLIFGMLAPVTYGFSFRKSDDRDLKLAVVGGSSLVCILLLAMGKAYVRRPPKAYINTINTVLYYVIMGITVSGVSYVVGDLISLLMEKLGWFVESSLTVPGRKPIELEWASY